MVPAALSAEDLYARALTATNAGRFPAARRLLDRARAAAADPDLRARVDLTAAYVESETESPARGLELALGVLDRVKLPAGDLRPELVAARAAAHAHRARGGRAERVRRGRPLLEDHPEPLARVLINRGNVYLQQGDTSRAATDFTDAADRFGRAGLPVEQAKSRFNLGYVELLRGDLVAALRGMDEARDVLAPLSPAYRATVEQDRAEVLMAAGMSRGRPGARGRHCVRDPGAAASRPRRVHVLARLLVLGDPVDELRVARRAARRFGRQGSAGCPLRSRADAVAAEIAVGGASCELVARADARIDGLGGTGSATRRRSPAALGPSRGPPRRARERDPPGQAAHVTGSQPLSIRPACPRDARGPRPSTGSALGRRPAPAQRIGRAA